MTGKRIVTLDRLTLQLPAGSTPDTQAILREVTKALSENATASQDHLRVTVASPSAHEGASAFANRVSLTTAARLRSGGGS